MFLLMKAYLSDQGLSPTLLRALLGSAGIRTVGMGLSFLVGVQLARALGVEGYGIYGLAMSIISIAMTFAAFGLPQLVTRESARAYTNNDWAGLYALLRWCSRTVCLLALPAATVGIIAAYWQKDSSGITLLYAVVAGLLIVILTPLANIYGSALRGLQHIVKGQLPEAIFRPLFYSLFLYVGVVSYPSAVGPQGAMALQVLAVALSALVAYFLLQRVLPKVSPQDVTHAQSAQWFQGAWPMALTEAMRVVQGNLPILVLGVLASTYLVGIYRVGSSVYLLLTFPLTLINIVFSPIFAQLHSAQEQHKLQQLLGLASRAMVLGVFLLTLPFIFFGEDILGFLFGDEFREANSILLVLGGGAIVGSFFGPGATLLNMTGHERLVTRSLGFSLLVFFVIAPPLVAMTDAEGAAIASSIVFIAWNAVMCFRARRVLSLDSSVIGGLKFGWLS